MEYRCFCCGRETSFLNGNNQCEGCVNQERRRRLFEEVAKGCQNEEFFALQNGSEEYVEKSGDVCQKKTRTIFLPKLDKLTFETLSKITEAIIDAADAFAIKTKEG